MQTKLAELREEMVASEVRDKDSGMKAKAKVYADKKRNAEESNIGLGDKVLVKQERQNKFSTLFAPGQETAKFPLLLRSCQKSLKILL